MFIASLSGQSHLWVALFSSLSPCCSLSLSLSHSILFPHTICPLGPSDTVRFICVSLYTFCRSAHLYRRENRINSNNNNKPFILTIKPITHLPVCYSTMRWRQQQQYHHLTFSARSRSEKESVCKSKSIKVSFIKTSARALIKRFQKWKVLKVSPETNNINIIKSLAHTHTHRTGNGKHIEIPSAKQASKRAERTKSISFHSDHRLIQTVRQTNTRSLFYPWQESALRQRRRSFAVTVFVSAWILFRK